MAVPLALFMTEAVTNAMKHMSEKEPPRVKSLRPGSVVGSASVLIFFGVRLARLGLEITALPRQFLKDLF